VIVEVRGRNHLVVKREEILEIYRSVNENLSSVQGRPTQPTVATVVTLKEAGKIKIYCHFYLSQDRVGVLYQKEGEIDPRSYEERRREVLEEVESMGFIMNNVGFRALPEVEQERILKTYPVFGGRFSEENEGGEEKGEEKDPETILVLEEGESPPQERSSVDSKIWEIFFRVMGSL